MCSNVPTSSPLRIDRKVHIKGPGQVSEMRAHQSRDSVVDVEETEPGHVQVAVSPQSYCIGNGIGMWQMASWPSAETAMQMLQRLGAIDKSFCTESN